jgi:dipeptidyl aminopeptidase/acylaminoacyl peptidase
MLVRPALEYAKLATMQSITYKASDGTSIPAYLTLPPGGAKTGLPAIVMPHGGPSARDEWGFDWLVQFYAARGYAVLQPNYRGSSGYGDAWFRNQGFQKWKVAIDDVLDAGRWMVAQGIADPKKLAAVGWSYGGYAALQSAVVDPNLFKAVVAIAPVTDLDLLKQEIGSTTWANKIIGSGPHVREGSPAQNAARINAPVLLFHGELDRNVSVTESRVMADKLRGAGKRVDLVTIPKLDHYLEDSRVRADMLRRSDAFLRASMGM